MPDLVALQLLLEIRERGSLGAAGAAVGMSQQAASSRVRALEAPIVVRAPRGSHLTREGLLLAEWADGVVEAAARMDAGIAALRVDRAAHLDVAVSLTIAEHLMPLWLKALADSRAAAGQSAVAVRMEPVNSDAVAAAVLAGRVALGFVEGPVVPAGLRFRTVAHDRLVVAVVPGHPWARRRWVPAAVLAETPLVSRESGSGTRHTLRTTLAPCLARAADLAPAALVVPNAAAARTSVLAGLGPGALSDLAIADDLALGRLVAVEVRDGDGAPVDMTRPLRAVWIGGAQPPAGPARDLVALARGGRARRPAQSPAEIQLLSGDWAGSREE
jgi:DNA-binding transcriptional LysR family regulator